MYSPRLTGNHTHWISTVLGDVSDAQLNKAQLVWPDEVIDQIVYRSYGLGAEEIRVVEEKA
jgi:hypothetical protein